MGDHLFGSIGVMWLQSPEGISLAACTVGTETVCGDLRSLSLVTSQVLLWLHRDASGCVAASIQ